MASALDLSSLCFKFRGYTHCILHPAYTYPSDKAAPLIYYFLRICNPDHHLPLCLYSRTMGNFWCSIPRYLNAGRKPGREEGVPHCAPSNQNTQPIKRPNQSRVSLHLFTFIDIAACLPSLFLFLAFTTAYYRSIYTIHVNIAGDIHGRVVTLSTVAYFLPALMTIFFLLQFHALEHMRCNITMIFARFLFLFLSFFLFSTNAEEIRQGTCTGTFFSSPEQDGRGGCVMCTRTLGRRYSFSSPR